MSLLRKLVLGLAVVALLAVAVALGWRLYRVWTRPNIARDGGTVLIYEVDASRFPDNNLPADFDMGRLVAALQRRVDPSELYGCVVRAAGDRRVEISLPRQGRDDAERLALVKELIAKTGDLRFVILANTGDDREAIDAAQRYFDTVNNSPPGLEKLKAADVTGAPPPPPTPPDHKAFNTDQGAYTYSWIELGPEERRVYGLANDQDTNPFWQEMAQARKDHKAVLHASRGEPYGTNLFYSREVTNPDRLPEKDRGKKYEYFILTRDPERDEDGRPKAVTGEYLSDAYQTDDWEKRPAVGITFNSLGAALLTNVTTPNKGRQLAIVLDDIVQSAPTIQEPITRGKAVLHGNFTKEEVDRIVTILRAGALPAPLKPVPVSESTVEPRK